MATACITVGANTGGGVREYVAAALDVLDQMGIHYELTAMATNVEGDVQTICDALAAIGARRPASKSIRPFHRVGAA
jgi:uncharacterized protein YqgV (UPF0045/DUF77 family)